MVLRTPAKIVQGPKGERGATGPTGPAGPAGAPGDGTTDSDAVENLSGVTGANVTAALDALAALIAGIVSSVTSVFGRTGDVVATAGDYDSDLVDNASTVSGATVSDALDELQSQIAAPDIGIHYFDNTHTPIALWNFNNTLVDEVAARTLTLAAGATLFTEIAPGVTALMINVGDRYVLNDTALRITGDLTIQAIIQFDNTPNAAANTQVFARYEGTSGSETEANNIVYSFGAQSTTNNPPYLLQALWENGAGANNQHSTSGVTLPPIHNIMHVTFRRSGGIGRFYLNGKPFGGDSVGTVAATGGTDASARFLVGAQINLTAAERYILMALKVNDTALSDAEVLAEYNRTLGTAFGIRA